MMKLNPLNLFTTLFILLPLSTIAQAEGIPTFDVANSVNMAKSLANDARKIKALADQIAYWKQQMAMISGSRGMGALAAAGAVKGIPASWDSILQQVQDSGSRRRMRIQQTTPARRTSCATIPTCSHHHLVLHLDKGD